MICHLQKRYKEQIYKFLKMKNLSCDVFATYILALKLIIRRMEESIMTTLKFKPEERNVVKEENIRAFFIENRKELTFFVSSVIEMNKLSIISDDLETVEEKMENFLKRQLILRNIMKKMDGWNRIYHFFTRSVNRNSMEDCLKFVNSILFVCEKRLKVSA